MLLLLLLLLHEQRAVLQEPREHRVIRRAMFYEYERERGDEDVGMQGRAAGSNQAICAAAH
jgi:hypothetical protein